MHRTLIIEQKSRATAAELLTILEEDEEQVTDQVMPDTDDEVFKEEEDGGGTITESNTSMQRSDSRNSKIIHVNSFDSFVSEIEIENKMKNAIEGDLPKLDTTAPPIETQNTPTESIVKDEKLHFPVRSGFEQKLHVLLRKRKIS